MNLQTKMRGDGENRRTARQAEEQTVRRSYMLPFSFFKIKNRLKNRKSRTCPCG
jgi:hypothetical protein